MKIGFIGAGKMAEAIIASLIRGKVVPAGAVFASDISEERRNHLKKTHGINTYSRNQDIIDAVDVLVLAVKPQHLDELLAEMSADGAVPEALVISIAAGKRLDYFTSNLPGSRIVRVMPNLACTVGQAMSAYCCAEEVTPQDKVNVVSILEAAGKALEVPEEQLDAVTALSGSGPAFFAYVMDCLAQGAVAEGMKREDALLLAGQTMYGTALLLMEEEMDPRDLIRNVASAKGTTAEGLGVLEASDAAEVLQSTIAAAARRSRELSAGE